MGKRRPMITLRSYILPLPCRQRAGQSRLQDRPQLAEGGWHDFADISSLQGLWPLSSIYCGWQAHPACYSGQSYPSDGEGRWRSVQAGRREWDAFLGVSHWGASYSFLIRSGLVEGSPLNRRVDGPQWRKLPETAGKMKNLPGGVVVP